MVTKEQFVAGIMNYADIEVMPHLSTSGKWLVGTAFVLMKDKAREIADVLIENPIVKALGVSEDGRINEDRLFSAMEESAERYGRMDITIPLVGTMHFTKEDVCKLKEHIH